MKFLPAIALLSVTLSAPACADNPITPPAIPAPVATRAASAPIGNAKASAAKNAPMICPVSGDKIASPKAAYNSEAYKGKTYYFCCPDCKPAFDKNPQKYVKAITAAKTTLVSAPIASR